MLAAGNHMIRGIPKLSSRQLVRLDSGGVMGPKSKVPDVRRGSLKAEIGLTHIWTNSGAPGAAT